MIVGTAGHIDHGKTALVRALTGTDTDRLAQEKARGITIELGFAYADMGDGSMTGFVDMPGHERLIHTMISGAGGIDVGLIAIAADDGIMPQTREHLQILGLLGIKRAIVAITKSDLADTGRLNVLHNDITAELTDGPLAGAQIIPVSAQTGQGIAALRDALASAAAGLDARTGEGAFRMVIDRVFMLDGVGTVVTGTVLSGQVRAGDQLLVSPSGLPCRVRSLREHNQPAGIANAGARVALNLAGVSRDDIHRGDMAVDPWLHAPTARVDVLLDWVDATPFATNTRARLHSGATHAAARLVDLGAGPDGGHLVQAVLDRPLALGWGDRFILRDPSAARTVGGGLVLDLHPPANRRATPERRAVLQAQRLTDPGTALAALLQVAPFHVNLDGFLRARSLGSAEGVTGAAVVLGQSPRIAIQPDRLAVLISELQTTLAAFHDVNPDIQGMGREALRLSLVPRLPKQAFTFLLQAQAEVGTVALEGGFVRLPHHAPKMSSEDEALYARVAPELGGTARYRPPRVRDLAASLGYDEREIRRMMRLAARLGRVDQIARDHFFLRSTTSEMADMARDLSAAADDGWFSAPAFRDRMDNGRKVAIQILDFFDRQGLTLRRGDMRRINPHRADLY
ncbi:MAG: selenocysteine-specific translation elongation factor [Paracoccus denitrificans]|uniref:Selenocysteine-specific elongation factor n=1 Tax=Paracoccus denitrificans TaxID=266 RepID=A0A533I3Q9_PARDE|nr:MAG: selenocysteine-specific translation elongation factor [Paracoccus denitrificans]